MYIFTHYFIPKSEQVKEKLQKDNIFFFAKRLHDKKKMPTFAVSKIKKNVKQIKKKKNMEKYDYNEAVLTDVKEWMSDEVGYIKESGCKDREELEEWLHVTLWTTDSVTGNGSGSYTFSTWAAEENLCHNLDLLGEALAEFGCSISYLEEQGAEACDVAIRCYLLDGAISEALDELEEAGKLGVYLTEEKEEEE